MEREPIDEVAHELERLRRRVALDTRIAEASAAAGFDELVEGALDLFVDVARAAWGRLYLLDPLREDLVAVASLRAPAELPERYERSSGLVAELLRGGRSLRATPQPPGAWVTLLTARGELVGATRLGPVGGDDLTPELIQALALRLAGELGRARRLQESERCARRQESLISTIGQLSTTLDRGQVLTLIMDQARELLEAEATSIFMVDRASGDLVPHIATGRSHEMLQGLRVPKGRGIVGAVAASGQRLLVDDVQNDPRFYRTMDSQTGFVTRSILAVPLRTQAIQIGGERGELTQEIIGVAEVLNKRDGKPFDEEDVRLFEMLCSQAATVLQVAGLFHDLNELFMGTIAAFSASVDARDPYTQGHSLRVADFATAIARELGCDNELAHLVRIGGILHDIGKIGIPDEILNKPARLTDAEYATMREHPLIGERIMRNVPILTEALTEVMKAMLEHHERLDGRGYPRGLMGDQISRIGRIIGVADVFDALTSTRPYREALPVEEAFRILEAGAGREFDPDCVAALIEARAKGLIRVQGERPDPNK